MRRALATLCGTAVGLAIPAFWLWVGGHIDGGNRDFAFVAAATIYPAIGVCFLVSARIAAAVMGEGRERGRPAVRRASWNRSSRDSAQRAREALEPGERAFVVASLVAGAVYFALYFASDSPNFMSTPAGG